MLNTRRAGIVERVCIFVMAPIIGLCAGMGVCFACWSGAITGDIDLNT